MTGLKEKLVRYTYSATANTLTRPAGAAGQHHGHHHAQRLAPAHPPRPHPAHDHRRCPAAARSRRTAASLNGKILRLNLDGSIPANNPTPGSLVYTLGHRNPQGLVRLPSGRIYSSEHGENTDDEINLIEAGRNYGWPNVEGYCSTTERNAFCAANNVREPLAIWTPTLAVAGLAYYDHPAIPEWRGSLLMATLKASKLVQLQLSATGDAMTAHTGLSAQRLWPPARLVRVAGRPRVRGQ